MTSPSFDRLRQIVKEKQCQEFEWPGGDEPLLVDMQTANAMCVLHDALNDKNKSKMRTWIGRDRVHFCRMVEIAWSAVSRA